MVRKMVQKIPCLVWLPADHCGGDDSDLPYFLLDNKYAQAAKVGAQSQPVMFPLAQVEQIPALLSLVDGVLLSGSPSNVHPSHFGEAVLDTRLPLDPDRDLLTLALVNACIRQGVPLLGVCRGFQEINVALGGSLHQAVHAVEGMMDHREPEGVPFAAQYAPSHLVHFTPGSVFERWAGGPSAQVNSLHGQGLNRLAPGLSPMAHAPDGLVEAFGIQDATAFAYAVQWHPEWQFGDNPFYAAILSAFGDACREHQRQRLMAHPLQSL